MEDKDKREYLIKMKKSFYSNGMKCMFTAALLLILMFVFCLDGQGGTKYFPADLFWLFQKIVTGAFIIGAAGYLISLTIKVDEE